MQHGLPSTNRLDHKVSEDSLRGRAAAADNDDDDNNDDNSGELLGLLPVTPRGH